MSSRISCWRPTRLLAANQSLTAPRGWVRNGPSRQIYQSTTDKTPYISSCYSINYAAIEAIVFPDFFCLLCCDRYQNAWIGSRGTFRVAELATRPTPAASPTSPNHLLPPQCRERVLLGKLFVTCVRLVLGLSRLLSLATRVHTAPKRVPKGQPRSTMPRTHSSPTRPVGGCKSMGCTGG
jgi:hypothetical protein